MKVPFTRERADWVKVLEVIYENELSGVDSDMEIGERLGYALGASALLVAEADLEGNDVYDQIKYLREVGLLKENSYALTHNGLRLAHQIKMERKRRYTNGLLTLMLILISFIGIFPIINQYLVF